MHECHSSHGRRRLRVTDHHSEWVRQLDCMYAVLISGRELSAGPSLCRDDKSEQRCCSSDAADLTS
ncbi:hypothetical protein TRIATDRAFT_297529 [Trichoderma atroviride IMI 206040]|uniref:Uncharacterized protein n=1 Tax=Hypocrea atroviridis (strain ATCC 20476 / IMI 206040) TaxID=452589 RepID=G9NIF2_HYPAI|nr:uncharacterized protein TRIATDRAFT_297529 [Trichoderma atroviride IMI 206040]EHK49564.1 hypothetical protein TRIATDRAFT_297529 [Trichoderma atroviride IMI 206040]